MHTLNATIHTKLSCVAATRTSWQGGHSPAWHTSGQVCPHASCRPHTLLQLNSFLPHRCFTHPGTTTNTYTANDYKHAVKHKTCTHTTPPAKPGLRYSDTHLLARRALSGMAHLRACMPTRQLPPTHAPAAELVPAAALLHDCLAAEAACVNQQWAGRAWARVAQQQAAVLTPPRQRPASAETTP
jgi:hypothetical protein